MGSFVRYLVIFERKYWNISINIFIYETVAWNETELNYYFAIIPLNQKFLHFWSNLWTPFHFSIISSNLLDQISDIPLRINLHNYKTRMNNGCEIHWFRSKAYLNPSTNRDGFISLRLVSIFSFICSNFKCSSNAITSFLEYVLSINLQTFCKTFAISNFICS